MNKKMEELFYIADNGADFDVTDNLLTLEINRLLKAQREVLEASEYERIRDKIFAVAQLAKKRSFEVGFKVAFNLMAGCASQD